MPARRDPQITSRIMAAVRARDTRPEITVRRRLWALGYRYRIHMHVFGRPDLVFPAAKVALFIDGDFWHGNPEEWRRRGKMTRADMFPTKTAWWLAKIERNIARDREVNRRLTVEGWLVVRVWESSIASDAEAVVREVVRKLRKRREMPASTRRH